MCVEGEVGIVLERERKKERHIYTIHIVFVPLFLFTYLCGEREREIRQYMCRVRDRDSVFIQYSVW